MWKKNIGHNKAARETKPTFFCSSRTRAAYTAGTDAVIYSISVSVYSYFFRFTFIAYPSSLLVRGAIPSIQQQQKKKKSISSSRDLEVRSNSWEKLLLSAAAAAAGLLSSWDEIRTMYFCLCLFFSFFFLQVWLVKKLFSNPHHPPDDHDPHISHGMMRMHTWSQVVRGRNIRVQRDPIHLGGRMIVTLLECLQQCWTDVKSFCFCN